MGLFDFVKDAGEKILGMGRETGEKILGRDKTAQAAQKQVPDQPTGQALSTMVSGLGLQVEGLSIDFEDGLATVHGMTSSQAEKEKIILAVGNTKGVAQVDDQLTVETPETQAVLYTVKSGDSLSKIAKAHYGDAQKYNVIFEANQPMLKDPNKIYPGQTLRIPPISA
jgi:nucleoid-associated protein YgaU